MNSHIFKEIKEKIFLMKDVSEDKIFYESLFSTLDFDSLDYVEMQIFIFSNYGVRIVDEFFSQQKIISIEQLVNYVKENIKV